MQHSLRAIYAVLTAFMFSMLGMASAHAVDVTAVSAALTEGQANVETIGAAVLIIAVAIAVFKWVRKAF
jgi:acid phosphatase family membrane protein YuiD